MAEFKVLITTSGLGSRLGNLTNYTNKSLVRVGDIPAISHIVEKYPEQTSFVITLGHFGSYIKQFLLITYPERDFTFVEVDKYKGSGSSLGYSILQAKEELQCPFIFHASDTILTDEDSIPNLSNNWCAGAFKEETSQYRTLKINQGKVEFINEKGEINFDFPYIGLSGIKDYKLFWQCLSNLENRESLSDVHVINEMLKTTQFNFHKISNWLDIGNVNELAKARKYFNSSIEVLDKENESIFFFDKFVIKFFSDELVCANRVARAGLLGDLVPKLLDSSSNFFKYEKAEGSLFAKSVNEKEFNNFLNWSKDNLWLNKNTLDLNQKCYDFYINKTLNRIDKYLKGKQDTEQVINGEIIPPVKEIINNIDTDWLSDGVPSQFHGDFILDNIIKTKDGFKLIDWRQDFAGDLEVGDLYYDFAKLNHNLVVNHEIVDKGYYNSNTENCFILCNSTLVRCTSILHKFIEEYGYDLNKVKVLTGIIWINMAPLHQYPFDKFLFNFGKYTLWQNLKQIKR